MQLYHKIRQNDHAWYLLIQAYHHRIPGSDESYLFGTHTENQQQTTKFSFDVIKSHMNKMIMDHSSLNKYCT